jgi:hypothetical protein
MKKKTELTRKYFIFSLLPFAPQPSQLIPAAKAFILDKSLIIHWN